MADESRLDFIEGRVEEQSRNWERVFAEFGRVDQKIDALSERVFAEFGRVDQKIDALGIALSTRIDANGERFSADVGRLDQKIDALGIVVSTRIDAMFGALDQKLDRKIVGLRAEGATQFRWTIGIMTALITGVLAAILTQ